MRKENLGNLVNNQRSKKSIAIKDLSRGICSVTALQRLERGEWIPSFFVLERIVERLGIVRRHIVGGANRTLISAITSLRSCGIGTCRRLSSG